VDHLSTRSSLPVVGASPVPYHPALTKRMQMRTGRQLEDPTRRRHRYVLVGLVMAAILVLAIFALASRLGKSPHGSASPDTTFSGSRTTTTLKSMTATRDEVIIRIHEIFRVRDQAIRTRNSLLLDGIYTGDCPCLKGDQKLIQNLRQERRMWRGVKVSLTIGKLRK
jgi:hypothetical protein